MQPSTLCVHLNYCAHTQLRSDAERHGLGSHAERWSRQGREKPPPPTDSRTNPIGRSRYVITDPSPPHFLTCTVMEWLPLFTRPALVDILFACWRYQQANQGLRLYGSVVLENHLHYLAQAPDLARCVSSFKSYTARQMLDHLEQRG